MRCEPSKQSFKGQTWRGDAGELRKAANSWPPACPACVLSLAGSLPTWRICGRSILSSNILPGRYCRCNVTLSRTYVSFVFPDKVPNCFCNATAALCVLGPEFRGVLMTEVLCSTALCKLNLGGYKEAVEHPLGRPPT